MYLPPVSHVVPLTVIRRERRLPTPGVITVRVDERVQALDVVAEAEPPGNHLLVDIARGLGVPASHARRYLACEIGERVEAGDVVAGPVGMGRRTVRAPCDCRVVALTGGRLLLEARAEPYELRAGFPGIVVSTDGSRVVVIETTGALIEAVWGNGQQDYGIMRLVGVGPADSLQADYLDINKRGAILVAGVCRDPEPLHQATELSVRGLILGGLNSKLIPVVLQLPYPVVVLEGFGDLPINTAAYDLLSKNTGREVSLDAHQNGGYDSAKPEVIIPLPASRNVDLPDELVVLEPGVRVRLLRPPYRGAIGVVTDVSGKTVTYPSGIVARSVVVDLRGIGPTTVPMANVEVLQ